jgi:cytidine deaminase
VTPEELVAQAQAVRENAYAPYSGYRVGAALEATSGRVYVGVNVENASYGLTICAERAALAAAVAAGERAFRRIAVVTRNGGSPCGACRQVLFELGPMEVLVADETSSYRIVTLDSLLPDAFGAANLGGSSD